MFFGYNKEMNPRRSQLPEDVLFNPYNSFQTKRDVINLLNTTQANEIFSTIVKVIKVSAPEYEKNPFGKNTIAWLLWIFDTLIQNQKININDKNNKLLLNELKLTIKHFKLRSVGEPNENLNNPHGQPPRETVRSAVNKLNNMPSTRIKIRNFTRNLSTYFSTPHDQQPSMSSYPI